MSPSGKDRGQVGHQGLGVRQRLGVTHLDVHGPSVDLHVADLGSAAAQPRGGGRAHLAGPPAHQVGPQALPGQGDGHQHEHQRQYGVGPAAGERPRVQRLHRVAQDGVGQDAGDHQREQVGQEQQGGADGQRPRCLAQADADHRQRRDQRDRDRHARQHGADVAARQGDRTGETGGDGGDQVEQVGRGATGDLAVREQVRPAGHRQRADDADHNHQDDALEHQQPGAVGLPLHHGQRHAHDRGGQRRDDHGADHRGRGVDQHPGAGDDRRQGEHRPERRELGRRVAGVQVEVLGQLLQGSALVLGEDAGAELRQHARVSRDPSVPDPATRPGVLRSGHRSPSGAGPRASRRRGSRRCAGWS